MNRNFYFSSTRRYCDPTCTFVCRLFRSLTCFGSDKMVGDRFANRKWHGESNGHVIDEMSRWSPQYVWTHYLKNGWKYRLGYKFTMEHLYKMTPGLWTGHVPDDVMWFWRSRSCPRQTWMQCKYLQNPVETDGRYQKDHQKEMAYR